MIFALVIIAILLFSTVSVPANTDEEMNGTLDQNETVRYHFPIPVIGITVEVCIIVGHVVVYGSVSVPNPNSAFYDWLLELEFKPEDEQTEFCESIYFDPSTIPPPVKKPPDSHSPSPTPVPTASVTPQPSVIPGTGGTIPNSVELTDQILYLSVIGNQAENDFVLNGTAGDVYPDTHAENPTNGTSDSTATSDSTGKMFGK